MADSPKTALVAGTGFVGAPLVRMLRDGGWEVTGIARTAGDNTVACDITDEDAVQGLGGNYDVIIHCASSGRGPNREERYRAVYMNGARNLLTLDHRKFIFVSSSSVYAQTDGSEVDEESPAEPTTATGRILRETEELVRSLGNSNVVARLAGIYGIGRSYLLKNFLEGKATIDELPGGEHDGRWINQIHNEDAASALAFLAEQKKGGGIFNVADSTPMRQRVIYEAFSRRFSLPVPPIKQRDLDRKRGWSHKAVANAKLIEAGWTPQFSSYLDALGASPELEASVRAQI